MHKTLKHWAHVNKAHTHIEIYRVVIYDLITYHIYDKNTPGFKMTNEMHTESRLIFLQN